MFLEYYGELLIKANVSTFEEESCWIFDGGMGFGDAIMWWSPRRRKRRLPHEGLDFVRFTLGQKTQDVSVGFLVVAPVSGIVEGICDDFLDKTVWLSCEKKSDCLVLLSHLHPLVVSGQYVICGDPVGIIMYAEGSVPCHLHLSVLEGQWRLIRVLTWDEIQQQTHARLVKPFL